MWSDPPATAVDRFCFMTCTDEGIAYLNALLDDPAWERVAAFPLLRFGNQHESALQAYRRRSQATPPAEPDMNLIAELILRGGIK